MNFIPNIPSSNLQPFISYLTFGQPTNPFFSLSQEEQHRLLHMLTLLQNQYPTLPYSIKGIWSILCLGFPRQSGLSLMTSYYEFLSPHANFKPQLEEDLKYIICPEIHPQHIKHILSLLGIANEQIAQKYNRWLQTYQKQPYQISGIIIDGRLFNDDQYVSQPSGLGWDLMEVFSQKQYHTLRSYKSQQHTLPIRNDKTDDDQQQTVTIGRKISYNLKQKKKRVRKPPESTVKFRMFQHFTRTREKKGNFMKNRREPRHKPNLIKKIIPQSIISHEQSQPQSLEDYPLPPKENYYEQLASIDIRKIVIEDHPKMQQFNSYFFDRYLASLKQKQIWQYLKFLIDFALNKEQLTVEYRGTFLKILHCCHHPKFTKYSSNYLIPLRNSMMTNIQVKLIAQLINIFYTSVKNETLSQFQRCCGLMRQIFEYSHKQSMIQCYYQCLEVILLQLQCKEKTTSSMIGFKSPLQLIYSHINISLQIEDRKICILLMVYLIQLAISRQWFQGQSQTLSQKLHQNILDCFKNKIDKKSQFLGLLALIYQEYSIPVTLSIKNNLFKYIDCVDMGAPQSEDIFLFVRQFTYSYIKTKIKENKPNFKQIMNRLLKNEHIMKSNENWQRIQIETLQIMLQFPLFHDDYAYSVIINYVKKYISFAQTQDKKILSQIDGIIKTLYRVKITQDAFQLDRQLCHQGQVTDRIILELQPILNNYYQLILKQYARYAEQYSLNQSIVLKEKMNRIAISIKNLLTLMCEELSNSFSQILRSSKLVMKPSLISIILQYSQLSKGYIQLILPMIYKVQKIAQKTAKTIVEDDAGSESDSNQKQALFFFEMKDRSNRMIQLYQRSCAQLHLHEFIHSEISLTCMKKPRPKRYYEFIGCALAHILTYRTQQINDNLRLLELEHSKEIITVKNNSITKTNYLIILQFLFGFFTSLKCISSEHKAVQMLLCRIKAYFPAIFNIIFISLHVGQQQQQLALELGQRLKNYECVVESDHFMGKGCIYMKNMVNLYKYMQDESKNIKIINSINNYFRGYLKVWLKFMQIYEHWSQKKSQIATNILSCFIFLLKCQRVQLIRQYEPYFKLSSTDSEIGSNVLKAIIISHKSFPTLYEYFKVIVLKNRMRLNSVGRYYMEYTVKKALKSDFQEIDVLLRACQEQKEQLLVNLIEHCLNCLLDEINKNRKEILKYFLKLFKEHPQLNSLLFKCLIRNVQVVKEVLRDNILQINNIHDVILVYILHQQCYFEGLVEVLWLLVGQCSTMSQNQGSSILNVVKRSLRYGKYMSESALEELKKMEEEVERAKKEVNVG